MSVLHFMMLMGYLAATSLSVRIVPNLRVGLLDDRKSCATNRRTGKKRNNVSCDEHLDEGNYCKHDAR